MIDYLVEYQRVLAGTERPFDPAAARDLIRRDVERARDIRTVQNHDAIPDDGRHRGPLSSITTPTLVIHGTADPVFPLEHGAVLTEQIPGAEFLRLEGAGHGLARADWETVALTILERTHDGRVGYAT